MHASPEVYPDPEHFDPDRMLDAVLTPTTWLPFGGGNRRCLVANLALTELRVILRAVLRGVDLHTTAAPGERRRVRGVIHQPHRGAVITVAAHR